MRRGVLGARELDRGSVAHPNGKDAYMTGIIGIGGVVGRPAAGRQTIGWATFSLVALPVVFGASGCQPVRKIQAEIRAHRGDVLLKSRDLTAALREFEAAAALDPQMARAYSQIGDIQKQLGHYDRAIEAFVAAVRNNRFSFNDALGLARLYHFTRRIGDAIRAYLHAVELKPDHFEAQLNLGVCYQQSGDVEQAIERFRKAIDIDPSKPHSYVNLGVALDRQGKYYEAIGAYKNALERDSQQPWVLVYLARTYMNQNRLPIARHALSESIRMDPNLAIAHEAMGYCLFRSRDFTGAERAYSHALSCNPNLAKSHSGLGSIKMLRFLEDDRRIDLRSAALEHWHRSLELDPHQPRIRKLVTTYSPSMRSPEDALLNKTTRR